MTYATFHPFDGEAERDLTFAAGRQATSVLAARSAFFATFARFAFGVVFRWY